jgi:hypothetical protein
VRRYAAGAELAGGDNTLTLAAAGVKPDARLALVARADHDAEDLTGLEMPLGPVAWEGGDNGSGEVRINRSTHQVKPFYLSSETVLPIK